MRKVLFSPVTKVIAFVLAVACLVGAAYSVADTFVRYEGEEDQVYDFEVKFEHTYHFYWMLHEPIEAVYEGNRIFHDGETQKTLRQCIEEQLAEMENGNNLEYCVLFKDMVFTNCGKTDMKYFTQARFSYILSRSGDYMDYYWADWVQASNAQDTLDTWVSIKDDYVQRCEAKWHEQEDYIWGGITEVLILAGVALVLIIYLICVCGKRADGEHRAIWLDAIWTELHLAVIAVAAGAGMYFLVSLFETYWWFDYAFTPGMFKALVLWTVGAAGALIINSLLSLVRKIKCKRFLKTSLIVIILKLLYKVVEKLFDHSERFVKKCLKLFYRLLTKKSGLMLMLVMLVYTVLAAIVGACLTDDDTALVGIIIGLLLFGFVCLVLSHRGRELEKVRDGAEEIRGGNLTYTIPELRSSDLNTLAQDINEIAAGLDRSVAAKVRAERLKTELITNVSHDLKTPLTSIINYTELLGGVEGLPEEARDYAQIIAKKSDRLKRLTQDLFDISKVQSGNEEIVSERIDISLLIAQSLGEHDGEIKKSGLNFCVNLEKELYVSADGRKMSRVIGNLMGNVLKYAMKNTRVFVTAVTQGENAVVEFKNTSAYPMDFDAQEIMGRFVRGDKSRSVEGNGLGLAIVHSYVEACGGRFEVVIDGDLFKAIISFPKIK